MPVRESMENSLHGHCQYNAPTLIGNLTTARQGKGKDAVASTERVVSQDEHHPSSRAYKSRVTELSTALTFSEDVVSSRSPHCISYAAARRGVGGIFRAEGFEQELRRKTTDREQVGRHNCRGESKKHTCNFYSPVDKLPSRRERKPLRRVKSVPSRIPESVSSSESDSGSVVHQRAREVPASVSVRWEEQTLHRLSSATARRLVAACPRARDRERMDTLLERKHEKIEEARSTERRSFFQVSEKLVPTRSGAEPSSALILSPAEGDEGKSLDDDSPPRRDFSEQLRGGARPVRQKKLDDRTIVLDNDARFVKALQRAYPQEPRDWCETEAAPDPGRRRYVRGQLRWTDMPQPVKVSGRILIMER